MTQQWVRKRTWDSAVCYIGNQQWVYMEEKFSNLGLPLSLSLSLAPSLPPSVSPVWWSYMPQNSVSLFLQILMYILIKLFEVLFSISGLEFAYSPVHTHNPAH